MLDVYFHPNSFLHYMGSGHLEAPIRLVRIEDAIRNAPYKTKFRKAKKAKRKNILKIHHEELYERLHDSRNREHTTFTPDTVANNHTFKAALTAAGGAIKVGENSKKKHSFGMLRPPGHHSIFNTAMGFCFFNNMAISVKNLLDNRYSKIAIIDVDNHHGNGTQAIFNENPNVLYTSLHADPRIAFPGTGDAHEIGAGEGKGTSVNIPLPHRTDDSDYLYAFDTIIIPIVRQFKPDAIMVSLGLDGLDKDPYGSLGLSSEGFRNIGARIGKLAHNYTKTKVGALLEGGYKYDEIGKATVNFFDGIINFDNIDISETLASRRIQNVVYKVRSIQRNYWYGV